MIRWPEGIGRIVLDSIDSTNAEALRRLAAGAPPPFWVMARRQTAARGRRGRAWLGGAGDFAASLAMRPAGGAAQAALRSFVAALALADTAERFGVAPERVALKWPNDVLLDGRKIAGILLESTTGERGLALVCGIGVNLAAAPAADWLEPGATPAAALSRNGTPVPQEAFLDVLALRFDAWERILVSQGFEPVRRAWLDRAARLGQPITARLPGREVRGRFRTVDASGAVVLDTPAGPLALPAAEIHF